MWVLLTIEDKNANAEMVKELSEFVPLENIINIYEYREKKNKEKIAIRKYSGKGFLLCDFLPLSKKVLKETVTSERISVRIIYNNIPCWNAINMICQAFMEDSVFDLLVIISEYQKEKAIQQVEEKGYAFILGEKYRLEEDRPDILILTNTWDSMISEGVSSRGYAKLIIVAYMWLVGYWRTPEQFWQYVENGYGRHRPDYYLFDSLLYKELSQLPECSGNIVEMGNAKFDGIYQAEQNKEYIGKWEKLKGKVTILWAPTHGVDVVDNVVLCTLTTFDLYARTFFEYADKHPEMGFIFRPHGVFIHEMRTIGFWSENDVKQLKKYCADSSNIVFDEANDTYNTALAIADGILTDAYCGITCSALPTLKPICATYRSKEDSPNYGKLLDSLYSAYEAEDIVKFFDMLQAGKDPMYKLRKQASKKYVKNFDGKNGWRIKEFIKNKYFELIKRENVDRGTEE